MRPEHRWRCRARAVEQDVHRPEERRRPGDAERVTEPRETGAGREKRDLGFDAGFTACLDVPDARAVIPRAGFDGADGLDAVRQLGAGPFRSERHGPRQSIGVARLVVVPDRPAREAGLGDPLKESPVAAATRAAPRQMQFRRHIAVARAAHQVVRLESPHARPTSTMPNP
jgi:hypothetical protein